MKQFDSEIYYKVIAETHYNLEKNGENLNEFVSNKKIFFEGARLEYSKKCITVEVVETLAAKKEKVNELSLELKRFCLGRVNDEEKIAENILPREEIGSKEASESLRQLLS